MASVPNTQWTSSSVTRVYSDPFGGIRGASDAGVPGDHRFLGATRDADSGLSLLGARYYDPVVGCFISVDPVLNDGVPAHLNAYVYGFNNPVTFSDASGLEPKDKNGNYDGAYYGGGSGSSPPTPSTSWAALAGCAEVTCNFQWAASFGLNYYGGMAEVIGDLLWMTCGLCAASTSIGQAVMAFSDPDAYFAQQQAQTQIFQEFWSDPWGNFWRPIGDDWANNPGHALGATVAIAGTSAIPGGGLLKGGSAAAKVAEVGVSTTRAPIGFVEGLGSTALTSGRLQHGTAHLTEAGLLPAWSGKNSSGAITRALTPILENPSATFDHALGGTPVKGFLGQIEGQPVAAFVFKEGAYAGELATSFVPTVNQLKMWGLQ